MKVDKVFTIRVSGEIDLDHYGFTENEAIEATANIPYEVADYLNEHLEGIVKAEVVEKAFHFRKIKRNT